MLSTNCGSCFHTVGKHDRIKISCVMMDVRDWSSIGAALWCKRQRRISSVAITGGGCGAIDIDHVPYPTARSYWLLLLFHFRYISFLYFSSVFLNGILFGIFLFVTHHKYPHDTVLLCFFSRPISDYNTNDTSPVYSSTISIRTRIKLQSNY